MSSSKNTSLELEVNLSRKKISHPFGPSIGRILHPRQKVSSLNYQIYLKLLVTDLHNYAPKDNKLKDMIYSESSLFWSTADKLAKLTISSPYNLTFCLDRRGLKFYLPRLYQNWPMFSGSPYFQENVKPIIFTSPTGCQIQIIVLEN